MYEIKALKSLRTSDGIAYTANLYCDGKKVGSVENQGTGGPTNVWWNDQRGGVSAMREAFTAWAQVTLGDDTDEESGVESLITWYENDKASKKEIIFKKEADPASEWQEAPIFALKCSDLDRKAMRDAILKKFPNGSVWDTNQHRWVGATN